MDYITYSIKIRIRDLINCINSNNYIKIYYSLKHGYKMNNDGNKYTPDKLELFNKILQNVRMENVYINHYNYELFDYLNNNLDLNDYVIIPIITKDENIDDIFLNEKINKYAEEIKIENYEIIFLLTERKYIYL